MYSPKIVEKRLIRMIAGIRQNIDPRFEWTEYTVPQVEEWVQRLDPAWNPEDMSVVRTLSDEEQAYIRHEINRCKVDFRYWLTRYCFIKDKKMDLIRLNPTNVQEIFLSKCSEAEEDALFGRSGDGLLFACLKARQLGVSTLSEAIIAHRTFFYGHSTAIIAADVDERTQNLYEMIARMLDHMPWWMKPRSINPKSDYRVKNKQLSFHDQDSIIRFAESSNMQGGDSGTDKGSMGTGQTLPLVHLSELALWQNPYQIMDALMPSIPYSPRTFAVFESTAKGRNNWWHETWMRAKRGLGRLKPVFIPWYADPGTYKLPAPSGWTPSEDTLGHAERVKETSPVWMGHTVHLTKDQLFWYEKTRAEYADGKILNKFLAEYAADDLSAFQASTVGVFGQDLIDDMRNRSAKFPVVIEIKPKMKVEKLGNG